jgi:hypothetical protein
MVHRGFFLAAILFIIFSYNYLNPYSKLVITDSQHEFEIQNSALSQPYHFLFRQAARSVAENPTTVFSSTLHVDRVAPFEGGALYRMTPFEKILSYVLKSHRASEVMLALLVTLLMANCLAFYALAQKLGAPPSLSGLFGLCCGLSPFALDLAVLDPSSVGYFHWPLLAIAFLRIRQRQSFFLTLPLILFSTAFMSLNHSLIYLVLAPLLLVAFMIHPKTRRSRLNYLAFGLSLLLPILFLWSASKSAAFSASSIPSPQVHPQHPLQFLGPSLIFGKADINPLRLTLGQWLRIANGSSQQPSSAGISWALVGICMLLAWKRRQLPSKLFLATLGATLLVAWIPFIYLKPMIGFFVSRWHLNLQYLQNFGFLASFVSPVVVLLLLFEISRNQWNWWPRFLKWCDPIAPRFSWLAGILIFLATEPPINNIHPYISRVKLHSTEKMENLLSVPFFHHSAPGDLNVILDQASDSQVQLISALNPERKVNRLLKSLFTFEPNANAKNMEKFSEIKKFLECAGPKEVIFTSWAEESRLCDRWGWETTPTYTCRLPQGTRTHLTEENLLSCLENPSS